MVGPHTVEASRPIRNCYAGGRFDGRQTECGNVAEGFEAEQSQVQRHRDCVYRRRHADLALGCEPVEEIPRERRGELERMFHYLQVVASRGTVVQV